MSFCMSWLELLKKLLMLLIADYGHCSFLRRVPSPYCSYLIKKRSMFDSLPKLAMPKVGHATIFSVVVWFTTTIMVYHIFLAPCLICHRLIFVTNFTTSVASILLVTVSMAATLCWRLGMKWACLVPLTKFYSFKL